MSFKAIPDKMLSRSQDCSCTLSCKQKDLKLVSYWKVVIDGMHNKEDKRVAQIFGAWHFMHSQIEARCIQSVDKDAFIILTREFRLDMTPAIIMSNSSHFNESLRLDAPFLAKLDDDQMVCLFTQLHIEVTAGTSLARLKRKIVSKKFCRYLQIAYKEIKSFATFQIRAEVPKVGHTSL
jgi:hypothetical protein